MGLGPESPSTSSTSSEHSSSLSDSSLSAKTSKRCKVLLCMILFLIFIVFVVAPLMYALYPILLEKAFFSTFRRVPWTDYNNLTSNKVKYLGRAFYLHGQAGKIGVWHLLPKTLSDAYRKETFVGQDRMESSLSDTKYNIVVYLHGTAHDRTYGHRVALYNLLNGLDYHVVTFDYRGYGDSDGTPDEQGLVNDSRLVYSYVKRHCGNNTVVFWGHSMGSAVSTKLAMDLSMEGYPPHGLILESAFNTLFDAFIMHWGSIPIRWFPDAVIRRLVADLMENNGNTKMETEQRIKNVDCPILILHAVDDHVVSVVLARKLYKSALEASRDVRYVEFEAERRYRHKYIHKAPELLHLIPNFVAHVNEVRVH